MKVRISSTETALYNNILDKYGEVLKEYELSKGEYGTATIVIDRIDELFTLDVSLKELIDTNIEYWSKDYKGLLIESDDSGFYIEIQIE